MFSPLLSPTPGHPERGVALIMALLVLLLLSVLSGALLMAAVVEIRIADNYQTASQLVHITASGIEDGRETLRRVPVSPSVLPFIEQRLLVDSSGRDVGRYSVFLNRGNPLTMRSVGMIGTAHMTIETRLLKSGFPRLFQAVTLAETLIVPPAAEPQFQKLKTPAGLERLVTGMSRNATEVYRPAFGSPAALSAVGSPSDYRVVVVDGDCTFGGVAGFGLLLVRGDLTVHSNFSWNGLILVIGQGTLQVADGTSGWIDGGLFLARTRDSDRSVENVLGSVASSLGTSTLNLGDSDVSAAFNADEWDRANAVFPYVPISYREF